MHQRIDRGRKEKKIGTMSSAPEYLSSVLEASSSLWLIQRRVGIILRLHLQSTGLVFCTVVCLHFVRGTFFWLLHSLCEKGSQWLCLSAVNYCISTVCRVRGKLPPSQRREAILNTSLFSVASFSTT
jgi:hypothetical protein